MESERGSGAAGLELRGGCQCGSIHYRALVEDDEAYYCHCRMCQKAFGNLFGAFFFALEDTVEWEAGSLAYYRSSKIARRGFCRECGTPLSFEDAESGEIHLTVGSLDEPERLRPVAHYGFEGHVGPFFTDDGLPRSSTEDDEGYVERWKAAHGRDSMPGPLDGPIARPSPEGSCTIQHAKWHSVQIPSAHIGSGEGPRGSDRPGNARPPRLHLPWEAHRVVRNRIFWKKENKMQVTDARGLITYDVVVVGGGVAGLGGALILGRSRRSVLVIDAGEPRNAPAAGVHGFLTRDGMAPAALLEAGREEVRGYGAEVLDGRVASAESVDGGFTVMLEDGRRVGARRLLVATGLVDDLPDVPGVRERWGRDVLHCPYCHGWEVRDRSIGVLSSGPMAVHQALLFRQLTADLTLFLHTGPRPTDEEVEQLAARGITVVEGEVASLEVNADRLTGVRLQNGEVIPRSAVVVGPRFAARAGMLAGLGLETTDHPSGMGEHVEADATGLTAVPGVWVAGNVTDLTAHVLGSASAGAMAGAAINADLVAEDTREAVATPFPGRS